MTRKECLDKAAECVLKDRQNQYGGPENNFERIAEMWSAYLGNVRVHSWDVAAMMGMLKLARARFNPKYADNWIDLAGYAACGVECATMDDEFDKSLDEFQKKSMEHMFKKVEGVEDLVQEELEPEFNPRDKVQAKMGDGKWRDAVVSGKEIILGKLHYTVSIHGFDGYYSLPAEDIRPAPKAEGVEELVQDAPRTREELLDRIVDCNPSVFKPRTPTGEELAEMAEEEAHG